MPKILRKNSDELDATMNCCTTSEIDPQPPSDVDEAVCSPRSNTENRCIRCDVQGRPIELKTVLLMLKPDLLEQAISSQYCFCSSRDCPIVYFALDGGRQFTIDDLRQRVGIKVKEDPVPLCYCFGFDESEMREEIKLTGDTTIPERVSRLIQQGWCACESRNPAGVCCLGELNRVRKNLKLQLPAAQKK